jgi:hypothetical protein
MNEVLNCQNRRRSQEIFRMKPKVFQFYAQKREEDYMHPKMSLWMKKSECFYGQLLERQ